MLYVIWVLVDLINTRGDSKGFKHFNQTRYVVFFTFRLGPIYSRQPHEVQDLVSLSTSSLTPSCKDTIFLVERGSHSNNIYLTDLGSGPQSLQHISPWSRPTVAKRFLSWLCPEMNTLASIRLALISLTKDLAYELQLKKSYFI